MVRLAVLHINQDALIINRPLIYAQNVVGKEDNILFHVHIILMENHVLSAVVREVFIRRPVHSMEKLIFAKNAEVREDTISLLVQNISI